MKRALAVGAVLPIVLLASSQSTFADPLVLGNLLVSGSVYLVPGVNGQPGSSPASMLVPGVTALPGGGTAVAGGAYPNVFNNDVPDPSFGVTTPVILNQYLISGGGTTATLKDSQLVSGIVTSFSSKSELALNVSTNGSSVSFMGYISPAGNLDVSNANTPGHIDATNPVSEVFQRGIASIDASGHVVVTPVNSYSGNNGRGVVLANNINGTSETDYLMVGNAGNSGKSPSAAITTMLSNNTGVQLIAAGSSGDSTVVGVSNGSAASTTGYQNGFTVTSLGYAADKSGKDDNFRGETIFNNTLYVTKGSGGNGINTVYQVGTAGTLPTAASAATTPITILPGLPTGLATNIVPGPTEFFPFGIWFADANTLYVGDEGSGKDTPADNPGNDPNAGLEKWSFNGTKWILDYTLQAGLIGVSYTPIDPTGATSYCGPVLTDGLRNITGRVNLDGTVTIFGVTSTVSCSGDPGADPNLLVSITDKLSDMTALQASGESFSILDSAAYGEVFRGVSFTPVPEPTSIALIGSGILGFAWRRRHHLLRRVSR
jgi:hypothetical protein